ncbi:hypothetical protein [Brevundimonas sp. AJA228-03]|uniref:hypothetical protein n=1 Tax=Brevundimonas sp. AJA228-03 TaxID=2752515 RepID=UPI001ADFC10C|nr:hypothetical protein [Brevundimonas sp. AJA228-03]
MLVSWLIAMSVWIATALPGTATDWTGDWVWSVEGKPAMVFHLDPLGGGQMIRPRHLTMDANAGYWRMIDATAEQSILPVTPLHVTDDEVLFSIFDADSGETTRYRMMRESSDEATLSLADTPAAPAFPLRRATTPTLVATDWIPGRAYGRPPFVPDNTELARLFSDDQAVRQDNKALGLAASLEDAERRAAVRRLLDTGQVRSAADHYHAAFIFQHGDQPDDYLLAHALAMAAVARGRDDAAWIAAATLDRYLQSIGRAQIYGTQFQIPGNGSSATQGAYNRTLVPDSLRTTSGVPPLAAQADQLRGYDRAE